MTVKQKAQELFERIKMINRYSGEDQAVRLLVKEIAEEIKQNPNPDYWQQIAKEMEKQ